MTLEELGRAIQMSLSVSRRVEIDGLGVFVRQQNGDLSFVRSTSPRVFLAYAKEDFELADRLYRELTAWGYSPWLDDHKLLPGENWPRRIEEAIESSDFFIACFSGRSVSKRGGFQAEVRYALDCARRLPLDEVFLIPVRLDECRVPLRIQRETQYVDLFPDWARGMRRIQRMMQRQRRIAA